MDAQQQQFYDFVRGLISLAFLAAPIFGPFVLMRVVIGVFRWANRTARGGGDVDELREGLEGAPAAFERRRHYLRDGQQQGYRAAAKNYWRR